jgi:oligoribonuclease
MSTFAWLDLETTGLDAKTRQIIAIGLIITDEKLHVLARFERLAKCPPGQVTSPSESWGDFNGAEWDEAAYNMHINTGLYGRCKQAPFTWEQVALLAQDFLIQQNLNPKTTYFAGSSVHFDIAFLREHAPELLKFAHYRMLDVSVFKVLGESWGVEKPKGDIDHMPLKDLEASIDDLKFWLRHFFKPETHPQELTA